VKAFQFDIASRFELPSRPSAIALCRDGETAVAACRRSLCVSSTNDGSRPRLWNIEYDVSDLAVCSKPPIVAATTGGAAVSIYDLRTDSLVRQLTKDKAPGSFVDAPTTHVGLSPDGRTLVGTSDGNRICIFNVKTGLWEHIMFVKYSGCDVTFSPVGTHVVLFGRPKPSEISGHITMFRVRRGLEPLWTQWHESDEGVTSTAFSADGQQLITCGAGDGVRRWNVDTGAPLGWRPPHKDGKLISAWAIEDGKRMATIGSKLRVYQVGQAKPLFEALIEPATMVAPSADGRTVLVGRDHPSLDFWRMTESPV